MATQAQIDANRRNARSSTGPRTDEGKATVARNAVTHGFYCQHLILPGEDEAELQALRQSLYAQLQPIDGVEKLYAERFVVAAWKLKRLIASEQAFVKQYNIATADEFAFRCTIHQTEAGKFTATLERAMDKALAELTKLQKTRPERATEIMQTENNENKSNPASDTGFDRSGLATSVASVPPPDTRASMKIEIVKTNPIPPSTEREDRNPKETNPIPEQHHDPKT